MAYTPLVFSVPMGVHLKKTGVPAPKELDKTIRETNHKLSGEK